MTHSPEAVDAAFDQFAAVTASIASGGALVRSDAVMWSQAREILLASAYRDVLPGFIFQCLSIFKFRDFILLYHPDPAHRRAFLEELMEPADQARRDGEGRMMRPVRTARGGSGHTYHDPGMREWML